MNKATAMDHRPETVTLNDEEGVKKMVWQLLQVRHLHDTPLIFVGEMWFELVEWATCHMLRSGSELANPEDLTIPRCVKTTDEAIAFLEGQHSRWQKSLPPLHVDSRRDASAP